ncbi:MAG: quinone-dependent dihydroorotate dehydrogenase [Microscillaceae bacterium]|nr:quinone-dependent dihydroorotate dehydrogenase [Microscillaceae bacterium]
MWYSSVVRPLLFRLPPERVHYGAMGALQGALALPGLSGWLRAQYHFAHPALETQAFGLQFPNPIGLAAGFDKNAVWIDALAALGFGFVEIGTVTPRPQEGNPKPRLFRLPADEALINRMGFNNAGLDKVIENLKKRKSKILVGGNIGKNKNTPNEEAVADYLTVFKGLFPWVDYFVVNVSSPNTPNLRALQAKKPLSEILESLQVHNQSQNRPKPILLKIAPDLSTEQLDEVIAVVQETGIAGMVISNTTLSREGLQTPSALLQSFGEGGLSGRPLKNPSTALVRYVYQQTKGTLPIIGVGGICRAEDVKEKLQAGASLVQIYTGFVYEGPGMVYQIKRSLIS